MTTNPNGANQLQKYIKTMNESRPVGRPSDYRPEHISAVDTYLETYKDNDREVIPSKEGYARFIGSTKPAILRWAAEHDEFRYALEKIELYQSVELQNGGLSGRYNSTITKLLLSANHDMREKSDVTTDNQKIEGVVILPKKNEDTLEASA